MKFSTVATTLAAASSALAAVTVITATNEGNVYTKTIELADTDATLAEGQYLTSIVVTRGDTVYTKVITESSSAAAETTAAAAETTSVAAAAAAETTSAPAETTAAPAESTSAAESETKTLTLSKNGHWFTKTVTQAVGFVWTGEDTANWTGTPAWLANATSTAETASSTADVSTYTGGAGLASVGTGLLGVAVAGLLI
ncbi:unnamed protein product [Kluyveromyces dobzhanskii CBS 2104]|uniref:WGS project CCBQ000000000 data, contig 00098 n=1 Tax=Kluyveromyces dobzhanskii CBS 2104 TaxID=1427455 RepID=A0A0A8L5Y8_9SACH|nr:unnamed protein product [Kluyveromyces dobzhanskii CBS 2104]